MLNTFNTYFAGIGPKLAEEIGPSDLAFDSFLYTSNPNLLTFSRISEIDKAIIEQWC